MIALGVHFEAGWVAEVTTADFASFYLLTIRQGGSTIDLFFRGAAVRDAVRDALLQCPGCVARPEAGAIPAQCGGGDGGGGTAGATGTGGQPAVQAMDAAEEWEMPF